VWTQKEVVGDGSPLVNNQGRRIVRRMEWDEQEQQLYVECAWPGELNDVEVMTERKAIEANRGQLRSWARIGESLYAKLPAIAQAVESAYWRHMADDTLDRTTNHPEEVQSNVVEEVEDLTQSVELPDKPSTEDLAEQKAEDVTGHEMPDEWEMEDPPQSGGDMR
jgi:hypothetical protein